MLGNTETGYCGYGDTCKFLHDRGTCKSPFCTRTPSRILILAFFPHRPGRVAARQARRGAQAGRRGQRVRLGLGRRGHPVRVPHLPQAVHGPGRDALRALLLRRVRDQALRAHAQVRGVRRADRRDLQPRGQGHREAEEGAGRGRRRRWPGRRRRRRRCGWGAD